MYEDLSDSTNKSPYPCTIIPYKHPYLQIEDLYDDSTGMFVWDLMICMMSDL